jgi:hypothetical protein
MIIGKQCFGRNVSTPLHDEAPTTEVHRSQMAAGTSNSIDISPTRTRPSFEASPRRHAVIHTRQIDVQIDETMHLWLTCFENWMIG